MADFKHFIAKVAAAQPLTADEAAQAFDIMMSGAATPAQIGAFLMGLRVRGETVDEIAGAVRTMRAKMLTVEAPDGAMDVVGTGGDGAGTYNVSTAAAFVVAGCGVPVAKHGNRALSSKSGSADVLAALGVKVDCAPDRVARCISDAGLGFMFAPAHHAAMKHVGPTRVELGTRTLFNILGPLSNPAGVRRLLIGVFARQWVEPIAQVMQNLGAESVWVVHGSDGLDEITTTGPTSVTQLKDGKLTSFEVAPADAGLDVAPPEALRGGSAEANAEAVRAVLAGKLSPFRDVVVLNAAAALIVAGRADTLAQGAQLARDAIESGAARDRLDRLVATSNG